MPELDTIITNSVQYISIVSEVEAKITSDYDNAQRYVDNFYEKCRPISDDENIWNEKDWLKEDHTLESIKS